MKWAYWGTPAGFSFSRIFTLQFFGHFFQKFMAIYLGGCSTESTGHIPCGFWTRAKVLWHAQVEPDRHSAPMAQAEVKCKRDLVNISVPAAFLSLPEDARTALSSWKSEIFPFPLCTISTSRRLWKSKSLIMENLFSSRWISYSPTSLQLRVGSKRREV